MKKKLLCLMLACLFLVSTSMVTGATDIDAESQHDSQRSFSNSEDTLLLYESLSVTQADLESNFSGYAEETATVSMQDDSSNTFSSSDTTANVVGIVLDYDTELPVSGASISVDGVSLVQTGSDGRFQISNMASGKYDWSISAEGYFTANYKNYDVDAADGATIFTFYINAASSISKDRETAIAHTHNQTVPPDIIDHETFGVSATTRAMSEEPDVSDTVTVCYNGAVRSVNREAYIYTVLSSEMYSTSFYADKGLTELETWQLYCAQAIASNTFLEYAQSVYSNHSNDGYDVCATSCCQSYDPVKVTQAAINATADIFYTVSGAPATLIVMYEPVFSTYSYIWGAYFSSCENQGTLSHSTDPALRAVSCTDIAPGHGGNRYGVCQMGAATLARDGYSQSDILLYYYTDCDTVFCMLV